MPLFNEPSCKSCKIPSIPDKLFVALPLQHDELTHSVIGLAMKVHTTLGPDFLESVYEHALAYELRRAGLDVGCQQRLWVRYDGIVVGECVADMIVNGRVLVENKAVRTLAGAHEAQLVHYLAATGIDVGLLLNFGAESLQFRRKARRILD